MSPATVCWNPGAEEDLAALWLDAAQRDLIRRAAHEIDQLLRVDPASKGMRHALSLLGEDSIAKIERRAKVLPEDLQRVRCGPLDVFFVSSEEDAMVTVLHVLPTGR